MGSAALEYHRLTCYSPESLQRLEGIDWSAQPPQFKEIVSDQRVSLRSYVPVPEPGAGSDVPMAPPTGGEGIGLAELSRLLYFTNGVTGVIRYQGNTGQLLRAAPSAGALYPTEVYLAVRAVPGLQPGLYNYQAQSHELIRLWEGDQLDALRTAAGDSACFDQAPLCFVFTGLFWRSAWRYRERGYRRVLLDTGHVGANLATIAPHVGATVHPCLGFMDGEVNGLFFFDEDYEAALMLAPLTVDVTPCMPAPLWVSPARSCRLVASPLRQASDLPGSATVALHRASTCAEKRLADDVAIAEPQVSDRSIPLESPAELDERVPRAILTRRSARSYNGAPVPLPALGRALGFALGRRTPRRAIHFATRDVGLLRCHLVAFGVDGLDPGLYAVEGAGEALLPLSLGNFREDFLRLSLGQQIANTCAAVLVLTAPAGASLETYGDRAYRYLHLEAGAVGQRFQLAATAQGLLACGIGGFFDGDAAKLTETPETDFTLYLVTIGQ